jgi:GTPase
MIVKKQIQQEQKAILVGLVTKTQTEDQVSEYLDELAFLAESYICRQGQA